MSSVVFFCYHKNLGISNIVLSKVDNALVEVPNTVVVGFFVFGVLTDITLLSSILICSKDPQNLASSCLILNWIIVFEP